MHKILALIKPTKKSEAVEMKFILNVMEKLKKEIKTTKITLAGSFAKGTYLEGDKDVDIFVLFNHNVEKEALEGIVRAGVENAFPNAFFQIAYAEHPYVRLFLGQRKIDIIPAYELGHGRHFEFKSMVDRTVLHTEYILSKLNEKQKDEVRLLKKFLKANGLYGAEIKVQGFSGYLCELLICKYNTFMEAMKNIAEWKERTFIDIENSVRAENGLKKFDNPLVVIDPVDKDRNVSAVVNEENYFTLIALARTILKSKNKSAFFEKRKFSPLQLKKFMKKRNIYCIVFDAPEIVSDILWGQVKKFYSIMSSSMKKEGFEIIGHKMNTYKNKVCILFELTNSVLSENKMIVGPPLIFRQDCEKFATLYKKQLFIYDGKFCAIIKRRINKLEEFLPEIRALPLPSHLASAKNAKLYNGTKILENYGSIVEEYAACIEQLK